MDHSDLLLKCHSQLCCSIVPPAHWVPDVHCWTCSTCAEAFGALTRRHHCRCCGDIFCDACSTNRVSLPGWGIHKAVRVCDDCRHFEVVQLPMLLAGDVWVKPGEWTNMRHKRFLRLSADQAQLLWAPWRSDEGSDDSVERSSDISRLTCVSEVLFLTVPRSYFHP